MGATFEGFYLYMQTDLLSRDDLLDAMTSIEAVARDDESKAITLKGLAPLASHTRYEDQSRQGSIGTCGLAPEASSA